MSTGFVLLLLAQLAAVDSFEVSISNFRSMDLELRWQDGSTDGRFIAALPAMGTSVQNTFPGHVFLLVHEEGGKMTVVATFTMDPQQQSYVLEPAPGDGAALKHPAYLRHQSAEMHRSARGELLKMGMPELKLLESQQGAEQGFSVKFWNILPFQVELFWDDGKGKLTPQQSIGEFSEGEDFNTYDGHIFQVKRRNLAGELELLEHRVISKQRKRYAILPSTGEVDHPVYKRFQAREKFEEDYENRTGMPWLGDYPPRKPVFPMRDAGAYTGQTWEVKIRHSPYPGQDGINLISLTTGPPQGPRLFLIRNLISPEESEHIISLAEPRLQPSTTGNSKMKAQSSMRTSYTAFLPHNSSERLYTVMQRFADVLGVSDEELKHGAEELQVVRYEEGQEYVPHHDHSTFSARLATLLVFLDPAEEGGATSFPKAFGGAGLQVQPLQGSAVLFYSQLPDGNLDDLSLHGGMPVLKGVKRVCNLWLHSSVEGRAAIGKDGEELDRAHVEL